MANTSARVQFQGNGRFPHVLSIHGTSQSGLDECTHVCSSLSIDNIFSISGLGSSIMMFICFVFGEEEVEAMLGIMCIASLVTLGVFIFPLFCRLPISKYFLPCLSCLWLFYLFIVIDTGTYVRSGGLLWPWYIISIPLYLVPVAFAMGIISFYCVVLKSTKSIETSTHEDL
jgi:hypothetical protein